MDAFIASQATWKTNVIPCCITLEGTFWAGKSRQEFPMRKTILSVGSNHTLLGLRNKVLTQAGYLTVSAKSGAAALKLMRYQRLDAIILGHTLSLPIRSKILEAAKRESLPVIALHACAYEADLRDSDINLCGIDGAAPILDFLSDLFSAPRLRIAKTPR